MRLYAESSAVLAWLLGEPDATEAREALAAAEIVVVSELTLVECDRVLIRSTATGRLSEGATADRHARLEEAAGHWVVLALDEPVLERARRAFPAEPVRTLDALHLASALEARRAVPELGMLSLDDRVRASAADLGFDLLPTP